MEQNFDMINLEYVETRKVSIFYKMVAVILTAILTFTPMYEFIPQLEPAFDVCTYGIAGSCGCIIGF